MSYLFKQQISQINSFIESPLCLIVPLDFLCVLGIEVYGVEICEVVASSQWGSSCDNLLLKKEVIFSGTGEWLKSMVEVVALEGPELLSDERIFRVIFFVNRVWQEMRQLACGSVKGNDWSKAWSIVFSAIYQILWLFLFPSTAVFINSNPGLYRASYGVWPRFLMLESMKDLFGVKILASSS